MAKWFRVCASFEEEAEADRGRNHPRLLRCLNEHGVRTLLVGPHALAFHTKRHYTDDLDFFVDSSERNARRLRGVVETVALAGTGFHVRMTTQMPELTFEEAWRNSSEATYAGEQVFIIGRDDLLRTKEASSRTQDRADAELLRHFKHS